MKTPEVILDDVGLAHRAKEHYGTAKTIYFEAFDVLKDVLAFMREQPLQSAEIAVPAASIGLAVGAITLGRRR